MEDACAVYQVHLDIAPGATEKVVFVLGAATSLAEIEALAEAFASPEQAAAATRAVADVWQNRLGAIRVDTPDETLDLMVNRWLPYQSFASRILARAGFQQAFFLFRLFALGDIAQQASKSCRLTVLVPSQ